jgi:hypothetical protein
MRSLFYWVLLIMSAFAAGAQSLPPASARFEVDGSIYPWEVQDEGIGVILDNMTDLAGVNAVYMLAVMHKEHRPFKSPAFLHNPVHTTWEAEDSRVYFHPHLEMYGRIIPAFSDSSGIRATDWLRIVVDSAHARGLKAGAEVSHTYISLDTLNKYPEYQQRDINNKAMGRPCTNNPDVRAYLMALYGDLSQHYQLDFIQTCMWLFMPGNPEKGGTCFCESCQKEAKAMGFDLAAAIPVLRDNPNAQPQLGQWLRFRRVSTVKIYQLVADRIHQANPAINFRLNEIYPFMGVNDNSTGLYLEDLRTIINSCVIQEHTEQEGYANTLRRSWLSLDRSLLGPDMPLLSGIATRMASTPGLIKDAIRLSIDSGVQGIAVKHYDGSPYSLLRATRNGLSAAGIAGFTPVIGMEAEEMTLSGYSPDVYMNDHGVSTSSTGMATGVFDHPSGVYSIIVAYADEKGGQGSLTLFVGKRQKDAWKLNEDVGVWRRRTIPAVKIYKGDEIKIVGKADGSEMARVEFIEFIPQSPVQPQTLSQSSRVQPRPRLAFKHYPKVQIGFSTQNFQKAEPVNVNNLTSYIEYAAKEGYSFIELRDNMATLSADGCRVLADVAKRNKIAVIYEIQINPLDPAFGKVFEKALANTLLLPGPGILRALVSQSEFDADSTKKGWTKEELVRVGRSLDNSAAMAKARHIRFIVENLNEPFFGDPPAYYGLADLFAITSGTGLQFDIGNAFRNSSRAPADPGQVAGWLSANSHRWVTSHLKTLQGGSSQPFLTENPLPVQKVVELMGRQGVRYATIELLPVAGRQQCYDNHAKSIQFLKEKGLLAD